MREDNCPKCGSLKTDTFLKSNSKELVIFKECDNCGFEWNKEI
jgi:transcription elongation factor Elf1